MGYFKLLQNNISKLLITLCFMILLNGTLRAGENYWGLHLISSKYMGEFALKDHFGPSVGVGLGLHGIFEVSDAQSILLHYDFTYHQLSTEYQIIMHEKVGYATKETSFDVNNFGADYRWHFGKVAHQGWYLGLGLAATIAQSDAYSPTTGEKIAHNSFLGIQASTTAGYTFSKYMDAEFRLAFAQYQWITGPSAGLAFYIHF